MSHSAANFKGGKMAIQYNKDFNAEIRNTVRNFNKKVIRAEKRGFRKRNLQKVFQLRL